MAGCKHNHFHCHLVPIVRETWFVRNGLIDLYSATNGTFLADWPIQASGYGRRPRTRSSVAYASTATSTHVVYHRGFQRSKRTCPREKPTGSPGSVSDEAPPEGPRSETTAVHEKSRYGTAMQGKEGCTVSTIAEAPRTDPASDPSRPWVVSFYTSIHDYRC